MHRLISVKFKEANYTKFSEFILALMMSSLVINFQIGLICAFLIITITIIKSINTNRNNKYIFDGKLLSILAIPILYIFLFHYREFKNFVHFERTIEISAILFVFALVINSSYSIFVQEGFNKERFFRTSLYMMFSFLLLKIIYATIFNRYSSFIELIISTSRRNKIVDLNPNHVDDISIINIIFIILISTNIGYIRNESIAIKILIISLISFYLLLFIGAKSIGAYIGVIIGMIFCIAYLIKIKLKINKEIKNYIIPVSLFLLFSVLLSLGIGSAGKIEAIFSGIRNIDKLSEAHVCESGKIGLVPELNPDYQGSASLAYRLLLAEQAIIIWKESPIIGHGTYSQEYLSNSIGETNKCILTFFSHVHNLYLDIIIRGGILLLIFFLANIFIMSYNVNRLMREREGKNITNKSIIIFYVVYNIVQNIFDLTFIQNKHLLVSKIIFASIIGISLALSSRQTGIRTTVSIH